MTWIKSYANLGRHPKTSRLAHELGVGIAQAVGHLHLLWHWAIEFAESGEIGAYSPIELARAAAWEGDADAFVTALTVAGFIDSEGEERRLHNWEDYAGSLIAARQRSSRHRHSDVTSPSRDRNVTVTSRSRDSNVTVTSPSRDGDVTVTPKSRVEKIPVKANALTGRGRDQELSTIVDNSTVSERPIDLLVAVAEEVGGDVSALGERERGRQLAVAKRLIAAGIDTDEVRSVCRWLLSQSWRTEGIDLYTVERYHARWVLSGQPEAALPRARAPTTMRRGRCSRCGRTAVLVEGGRCAECIFEPPPSGAKKGQKKGG